MADTGREASETWEYTDKFVKPVLASVGSEITIVPHSLASRDLYGGSATGTLLIPAFTKTGALSTFCSGNWKAEVLSRFRRSLGYGPDNPVRTWLGISIDEIGRAKPSKTEWEEFYYPLIWDMRMRRSHCVDLIEQSGLPTPPKSSCWMCPYRRNSQWRRLKEKYPEDFESACVLDEQIRANDKQGGVWLHDSRVPLRQADLREPDPGMSNLFGEVTGCDSGMCWV
jgi:hypothetical protein